MIYFLQNGDAVKIGYAANAEMRTDYLQTGSPHAMTVIGTIDGGYDDETRLHRRFDHLRIRGEWFRLAPDLMQFITDAVQPDKTVRLEHGHALQTLTVTGASSASVRIHDHGVYVDVYGEDGRHTKTVLRLRVEGHVEYQDTRLKEGQIA